MKWLIFWAVDKDLKANMFLAVEWTTLVVKKEPEKIQAWLGIEAWALQWLDTMLYPLSQPFPLLGKL